MHEESVERLKRSQIEPTFFVWPEDAIIDLMEIIEEVEGESTIKEFDGLKEDGTRERFLVVFDADGEDCGAVNESFPCPPICP